MKFIISFMMFVLCFITSMSFAMEQDEANRIETEQYYYKRSLPMHTETYTIMVGNDKVQFLFESEKGPLTKSWSSVSVDVNPNIPPLIVQLNDATIDALETPWSIASITRSKTCMVLFL